jgi:hypothetical protein
MFVAFCPLVDIVLMCVRLCGMFSVMRASRAQLTRSLTNEKKIEARTIGGPLLIYRCVVSLLVSFVPVSWVYVCLLVRGTEAIALCGLISDIAI